MTVAVVSELRFDLAPDGSVWADGTAYSFWERYLDVFDGVTVIGRIREVREPGRGMVRSDGVGVNFARIPYYIGPWQYARVRHRVRRSALDAIGLSAAAIFRIGSPIAATIESAFRRLKRPFGVEVVGDPREVFAPGVVRHPLRPLWRWWFTRLQRRQCAAACGAAYVTEYTLQNKYPCRAYSIGVSDVEIDSEALIGINGVLVTHYSSVELRESDFCASPRPALRKPGEFRIVTVASLAQMYKGIDVLIDAAARVVASGTNLFVTVVGEGQYRGVLEARAKAAGLADRVRFIGRLPGPQPCVPRLIKPTRLYCHRAPKVCRAL
jgi:glycosyltransferase involved in cell wall biosynthesis